MFLFFSSEIYRKVEGAGRFGASFLSRSLSYPRFGNLTAKANKAHKGSEAVRLPSCFARFPLYNSEIYRKGE
jgi:hypothetical protein